MDGGWGDSVEGVSTLEGIFFLLLLLLLFLFFVKVAETKDAQDNNVSR
jgi:hypothetical protein